MNRFLLTVLILSTFSIHITGQQLRIGPYNSGWMPVNSFQGNRVNNLIQIPFYLERTQGYQLNKNWKLSFSVSGVITNGNKNFPPEKIKFQFNNVTSTRPNDDGIIPSASNLQAITALIPLQFSETFLIPNSTFDLQLGTYFSMNLGYDVLVEAGAYLEEYRSWQNYTVNLKIDFYNDKYWFDSKQVYFDMQIWPNDQPPGGPEYGISVDPTASNVLLEFKTAADYANGVSKTYPRAFSTTSTTPYDVQVHALSNDLSSPTSQTLPVSAINVTVKDHQSQAQTGNVNLSSTRQTILMGNSHTTPKYFDVQYSTQAGDMRFFNKSYEQFNGTIIYSIIPR
ncbi:hypothetical protein [Planobacterium oryzisoli]|uniref:Uncharacterized protein n=1 Tax=Planobacterium oryzisoli TaxID=2771435 RepID=A0A931E7I4_9FLAO|nr:hypothetical protein [Planobacterium oryzisoli]MBF5027201.1 hypothetical protein [Planobacterium oryzisoli]